MSQSVHFNQVNTDIVVEFNPGTLHARDVFKPMEVEKNTDVYAVMQKDNFDAPDDLRGNGTPSKPTDIGWDYQPYVVEKHALHTIITEDDRRNSKNEMALEAAKSKNLKAKVLNGMELKAFGSSGILRQTANNGGSANYDLTNLATADPRGMIVTAINTVELNCGFSPNTIVLGKDVARHIMRTTQYRSEFQYAVVTNPMGNAALPPQLYELNAIYVDRLINTNKKGQAKVPSRIMSDDVWIGYVDPEATAFETVTYGLCLWTREEMRSWWDNDHDGDKFEYELDYTLKLVAKECGYLCQSVLTA